MKTLVLVNHWVEGISNNKPPLGLGYLVAYLEKFLGFTDIAVVNTGTRTFDKIKDLKPEIVGFTAYSTNYTSVIRLMRRVKEELGVIALLGGPHITCLPHKLDQSADIGVIGEGEKTLLELMQLYKRGKSFQASELEKIPGIVFRRNEKNIITSVRTPIYPLDSIPLPNREVLDIERFLKPSQILMNNEYIRGTTMLTSRGCPFNCVYCHVTAKWGTPRFHSAERVADEIELLVKEYGVEGIYIEDDLFTANTTRIQKIVDGMQSRNVLGKVRFFLDLRANLVSEELMLALKKMGVVKVSLGLESGSEQILQYLKGGDVTVEQNRQAVAIANKFGIGCNCCFMIGAPPETREDICKSQDLIKEILNASTDNFCQVNVTTPLPGTKLWDYAIQQGYINEDVDWQQFSLSPLVSTRKDFYINEHIDFDEFQKIASDTMALCNSRRLKSIMSKFSLHYIRRIFEDPKLAVKIVRDYLRFFSSQYGHARAKK